MNKPTTFIFVQTIAGKPKWYGIEHLTDFYRGMVTLTDQMQIVDIAKMVKANGMGVVEFDYMKTIKPEGFGYRDMNFLFRMPNGLIVEFQAIMQEIAEVKPELHKIYDKWRPYSDKQIKKMGRWEEYLADLKYSFDGYSNAWNLSLSRSGRTHDELIRSLMKAFTTLGLVSREKSSTSTPTVIMQSSTQEPSSSLVKKASSSPQINAALSPHFSNDSLTSDSFITTSIDNISQNSDNATFRQGKVDNNTRHKLADPEVNAKFNEEIKSYNQGTHFYKELSLGESGAILQGADIPDREIVIYGRTLKKIREGHGIRPSDLLNLPNAINDPIFVMRSVSLDQPDAITILTELTTTKGNMLVVLRMGENMANIEVNKITSIYTGKTRAEC